MISKCMTLLLVFGVTSEATVRLSVKVPTRTHYRTEVKEVHHYLPELLPPIVTEDIKKHMKILEPNWSPDSDKHESGSEESIEQIENYKEPLPPPPMPSSSKNPVKLPQWMHSYRVVHFEEPKAKEDTKSSHPKHKLTAPSESFESESLESTEFYAPPTKGYHKGEENEKKHSAAQKHSTSIKHLGPDHKQDTEYIKYLVPDWKAEDYPSLAVNNVILTKQSKEQNFNKEHGIPNIGYQNLDANLAFLKKINPGTKVELQKPKEQRQTAVHQPVHTYFEHSPPDIRYQNLNLDKSPGIHKEREQPQQYYSLTYESQPVNKIVADFLDGIAKERQQKVEQHMQNIEPQKLISEQYLYAGENSGAGLQHNYEIGKPDIVKQQQQEQRHTYEPKTGNIGDKTRQQLLTEHRQSVKPQKGHQSLDISLDPFDQNPEVHEERKQQQHLYAGQNSGAGLQHNYEMGKPDVVKQQQQEQRHFYQPKSVDIGAKTQQLLTKHRQSVKPPIGYQSLDISLDHFDRNPAAHEERKQQQHLYAGQNLGADLQHTYEIGNTEIVKQQQQEQRHTYEPKSVNIGANTGQQLLTEHRQSGQSQIGYQSLDISSGHFDRNPEIHEEQNQQQQEHQHTVEPQKVHLDHAYPVIEYQYLDANQHTGAGPQHDYKYQEQTLPGIGHHHLDVSLDQLNQSPDAQQTVEHTLPKPINKVQSTTSTDQAEDDESTGHTSTPQPISTDWDLSSHKNWEIRYVNPDQVEQVSIPKKPRRHRKKKPQINKQQEIQQEFISTTKNLESHDQVSDKPELHEQRPHIKASKPKVNKEFEVQLDLQPPAKTQNFYKPYNEYHKEAEDVEHYKNLVELDLPDIVKENLGPFPLQDASAESFQPPGTSIPFTHDNAVYYGNTEPSSGEVERAITPKPTKKNQPKQHILIPLEVQPIVAVYSKQQLNVKGQKIVRSPADIHAANHVGFESIPDDYAVPGAYVPSKTRRYFRIKHSNS